MPTPVYAELGFLVYTTGTSLPVQEYEMPTSVYAKLGFLVYTTGTRPNYHACRLIVVDLHIMWHVIVFF